MVYLSCKKTAHAARCTITGQPHAITESRFKNDREHRVVIRSRTGLVIGYIMLHRDGDVWRCRERME